MFVLDSSTKRIKKKDITYTPGLFKIFDEIIVNAADNKQRDPNMNLLVVDIDGPKKTISVKNNGKGIPIVKHKEHKCYIPTLIFGHLLTGSNFDDNEKKTTGGRKYFYSKFLSVIHSLHFLNTLFHCKCRHKLKVMDTVLSLLIFLVKNLRLNVWTYLPVLN